MLRTSYKTLQIIFGGFVLYLVIVLLAPAVFAKAPNLHYKEGEIMVCFDEPQDDVDEIVKTKNIRHRNEKVKQYLAGNIVKRETILKNAGGGNITKTFKRLPKWAVVKLPAGITVQKAVEKYKKTSGILYVEPVYKYFLTVTEPNDPSFPQQWGLNNTGQTGGTENADINAPEAWDIIHDCCDIIVAVTDTGIDYTHEDLAANIWINTGEPNSNDGIDDDGNGYVDDFIGWDFAGNTGTNPFDGDNDPYDETADGYTGHGTHVAGIIGAIGNNGIGVSGVCWKVKLMPLKIFANDEASAYSYDRIDAIEYAIDNGANVINASWGGYYCQSYSEIEILTQAKDAGILFVASAGNDGTNNDLVYHYPSGYDLDNIISVMATNHDDNRAIFSPGSSNYGFTSVDIGAPGKSILSCKREGGYISYDGTSMAAPFVTGACALLKAKFPTASYLEIKDSLMISVDKTLPGLCVSGGRLNLYKALGGIVENAIYVDSNSPNDPGTGTYWDPFRRIQDAINDADNGEKVIIKDGIYKGIGNRNLDPNGKAIIIKSHKGPENCIIDCNMTARGFIFKHNEDRNTIIEGLTIINGRCQDSNGGGAIYCSQSSPTIKNCIITSSYASYSGGGIYITQNSSPEFIFCTISYNYCQASGGAICSVGSYPQFRNCLITNNLGYYSGCAGSLNYGNIYFINCTIADNAANYLLGTGGIDCWNGNTTVINSILWDNDSYYNNQFEIYQANATVKYSDIYMHDANDTWAEPNDYNINIDPLFADQPLGDYHLKSEFGRWTPATYTNGDFNNDKIIDFRDFAVFVSYWNSTSPPSQIDLVQDNKIDFNDLAILVENWLMLGQTIPLWAIDSVTSPCIDTGDPAYDYSNEPLPNGSRINMGAYGNTPQASKSPPQP